MHLDEARLIKIVKPYLKQCRPGDWRHALRVVGWVKKLGKNRKDIELLIVAAYIHDIGWTDVMPKKIINFEEMLKFEDEANKNTPLFAKKVLKEYELPDKKIKEIIRLIKATDKHKSKEKDEAIIVDADNLSKLCLSHLKEKYKPESYEKLVKSWDRELPKIIKTKIGKKKYKSLLISLKKTLNLTKR